MNELIKEGCKSFEVAVVFFSATGNTKKMADEVSERLHNHGATVTKIDITSYNDRAKTISLERYDAVMFGFPIYSLRAPRVCREWLKKLNGNGKKCAVFFTFGGFGKDPAHYFIKELLNKQNFTLVSTAEFLGAHTFNLSGWKAAKGRPNQTDFTLANEFVEKTMKRFIGKDANTIANFDKPEYSSEQLDQAEGFRFKLITQRPSRENTDCSLCMICEKCCPTHSMDAKTGIADPATCIACFRCIVSCPEKVLHTNDLSGSWDNKLKMHDTTKEKIDNMEGKMYL